jgi:hypothetical protein
MSYSTGMRLVDRAQIVQALEAKNYTGAAGTGAYISLKNAGHVTIVIQTGAWAGGTAAVTLKQATAIAGTANKALSFGTQYTNVAGTTTDLLTATAVASDTFNLSAANATHVIEVDAASLDIANGFDCLSLQVASPGANADLYAAFYVVDGPLRYAGVTPPSAITD